MFALFLHVYYLNNLSLRRKCKVPFVESCHDLMMCFGTHPFCRKISISGTAKIWLNNYHNIRVDTRWQGRKHKTYIGEAKRILRGQTYVFFLGGKSILNIIKCTIVKNFRGQNCDYGGFVP